MLLMNPREHGIVDRVARDKDSSRSSRLFLYLYVYRKHSDQEQGGGEITNQRSIRALYNRYRIKVSRELIKQQRIARAEQIADPGVTR